MDVMKRKVAWLTKNDLSMKVESSREKLQKLIMQAKSADDCFLAISSHQDICVGDIEVRRPSMDDWGSCGEAAGSAVFGCSCHSILPRLYERVFPTYHHMPNNVDLAEESEIARAKLQKKANKAKWCISSPVWKANLIVFSLNGKHIEHMMLALDALDSSPNGLLNLFEGCDRHPFHRFRKLLTKDLATMPALRVLTFTILGPARSFESMVVQYRNVNIEFQAQIFLRFLKYDCDPFTLFSAAHPRVTAQASSDHKEFILRANIH